MDTSPLSGVFYKNFLPVCGSSVHTLTVLSLLMRKVLHLTLPAFCELHSVGPMLLRNPRLREIN